MAEEKGGAGVREILESMRVLRQVAPEIRAKHESVESLGAKFKRWQTSRMPELPLEQRPYDPAWPGWFEEERRRCAEELPSGIVIEHFGSTSIPGLPSKNIIDVAVGLDSAVSPEVLAALEGLGYKDYGNSPIDPETVWLWRVKADRAYVIHLAQRERPWIRDMIDMRDYLCANPDQRDSYAELKRRLAENKGQSFLQYSTNKLAMWIELIDRAQAWRASQAK